MDYANEPLATDPAFRARLLSGLASVGRVVQEAFGGRDQDVEGGWLDGKFYVVQARPQVGSGRVCDAALGAVAGGQVRQRDQRLADAVSRLG